MNKLPLFQKGRSGGMQFFQETSYSRRYLIFIYLSLVTILFVILALRLFQLTVVKGEYYRRLSEENRIRQLIIEPPRGEIRDRKGMVVAKNTPADIEKNNDRLSSSRFYENPEAIAPLVGYRQIGNPHDLKNDPCLTKLKLGDRVGKKGAEKIFDCPLRGRAGKKLIEIDSSGKFLRTLTVIPPQNGQAIQLSFDSLLQQKAYELIKDKKGAIIGLRPTTGEVLILASSPSFNPQDFEDGNTVKIESYLTDEKKPLFNRATEGTYPPGSIFKLVVAAAALEEGAIDEKTLFEDKGILQAGPLTFGNWYFLQYGKTEGMVDIVRAIRRSNDIFFYQAGNLTGPQKLKHWAEIFGLGKKTNIGLDESSGLIPSPFWKEETYGDRWYTGDTYNFSIGQGYLTVTPLQVAVVTAAFANGGYLCAPQLLKVTTPVRPHQSGNCKKLPLAQATLSLIREGMKQACSPGGTGWPLFNFKVSGKPPRFDKINEDRTSEVNIQTACKTGTAESRDKTTAPHAWITIFAPFDDPEIALTVLVEEGGQGSDVAGPIAKEILRAYFERSE